MISDFDKLLIDSSRLVDHAIEALLPLQKTRLEQAMHYSALSAGKRLRPFLLLSVADMFNVERDISIRSAAVVEIIHSYSLIHDDLPAMDNDDLRRGKPSCHKKFDEATAILAGDALLTLSFEILADQQTHPNAITRCNLINILAKNIGVEGIAGGQMLDLIYEREEHANYEQITNMHWMKTSRLFIASCLMGAELGNASDEEKQHLVKFAEYFGLAFQFVDDLADVDFLKKLSDNNIVKLIGSEETKSIIKNLVSKAKNELDFFSHKSKSLNELAGQLISRNIAI